MPAAYDLKSFQVYGTKDNKWMEQKNEKNWITTLVRNNQNKKEKEMQTDSPSNVDYHIW